jgi:hypothetical protein
MGDPQNGLKYETGCKFRIIRCEYQKFILILFLLLIELKVTAPGAGAAVIFVSEPYQAYEKLIFAVVMVESSGDTMAFNGIEEAYGAFQIRPIRLLDYCRRTGKNYKSSDCFNYKISKEIFLYYALKNGNTDYQSIARKWNGSGSMTLDYWNKVKNYL